MTKPKQIIRAKVRPFGLIECHECGEWHRKLRRYDDRILCMKCYEYSVVKDSIKADWGVKTDEQVMAAAREALDPFFV